MTRMAYLLAKSGKFVILEEIFDGNTGIRRTITGL